MQKLHFHSAEFDNQLKRTIAATYYQAVVKIPFEGKTLNGYFFQPDSSFPHRRPTIIGNTSYDGTQLRSKMWVHELQKPIELVKAWKDYTMVNIAHQI